MHEGAELRELRDRLNRIERDLANLDPAYSDGHDDGVGLIISTAYGGGVPTEVGVFFEIQPATISGPEVAGTTPAVDPDPAATPILALCLGPNVPVLTSQVEYSISPDGYWVFNF